MGDGQVGQVDVDVDVDMNHDEFRSGKVEAEWGEAVKERRKMRLELGNLIRSTCFKTLSGSTD